MKFAACFQTRPPPTNVRRTAFCEGGSGINDISSLRRRNESRSLSLISALRVNSGTSWFARTRGLRERQRSSAPPTTFLWLRLLSRTRLLLRSTACGVLSRGMGRGQLAACSVSSLMIRARNISRERRVSPSLSLEMLPRFQIKMNGKPASATGTRISSCEWIAAWGIVTMAD